MSVERRVERAFERMVLGRETGDEETLLRLESTLREVVLRLHWTWDAFPGSGEETLLGAEGEPLGSLRVDRVDGSWLGEVLPSAAGGPKPLVVTSGAETGEPGRRAARLGVVAGAVLFREVAPRDGWRVRTTSIGGTIVERRRLVDEAWRDVAGLRGSGPFEVLLPDGLVRAWEHPHGAVADLAVAALLASEPPPPEEEGAEVDLELLERARAAVEDLDA